MTGQRLVAWTPLVVAAVLAALTFWLDRVVQVVQFVDSRGFGHDPDYIIENFKATAFDMKGQPRHQLEARRMTHYMDDDTTRLDSPLFTQVAAGRPPVSVRSQRALVTPDGDHIYFLDDVHMVRAATSGRGPVELTTQYLHVTPDAHRMQTDRAVTVRQAGSNIQAGSMVAEGEDPIIRFGGKVRSVYEKRG
ncbi:lipopolysaccharide export system protein LptC [Sulfuritortus calidifontis]|uniref:Lipopolysaccharide export system protein LptC n=1 Tax=Sulfuritortus calidifontis TaxID=1914471 RepID=A0A4R3JT42_9PROT|nr:LPS export ABC transporter periplasmic protein LptC [Sulfuritortus calidifontis]TCS70447.1 lipopolysaccharide export system protein LptC [Sulfuritortus calidifontis]